MQFYNICNKSYKVNFEKALMEGLAPDGGLYFPEKFPMFTPDEMNSMKDNSLKDLGYKVFKKWFSDEIENESLKKIADNTFDFPITLKKVGKVYILELFHGPTLAFKDIAARSLANIMSYFLQKRKEKALVLVATSGDTGGAVAQGFSEIENVKVVVLYPKGKVSKLQEEQLTRVTENVISLEVDGVFDDCQTLVKKAFIDSDLKSLNLTSANSINIGRLIPQSIYYIYAYSLLLKDNIRFIAPSGNMGNVTGGLFAYKMGFPFKSFVIATNENDSAVKYYKTGKYNPQQTISTLSNAMDVGNPSNFIRILELFNYDYKKFKEVIKAIRIDEKTVIKTIKKVYKEYNYLLDPHTAVGFAAYEEVGSNKNTNILISTASPFKFASEIEKVTGINVDDSSLIRKLQKKRKRKYSLGNNYKELKSFLLGFV